MLLSIPTATVSQSLPLYVLHGDHAVVNGCGLLPHSLLTAVRVVVMNLLEEGPGEYVRPTRQLQLSLLHCAAVVYLEHRRGTSIL